MLPACSVPTLITSMCCIGALHGFTSEFLLPDQPFVVIWNHPSSTCEAHGINLNLSAWGIVMNKDDMFGGRNMRIYYNFGHWPEIDTKSGRIFYGGVPQAGNVADHLDEVFQQVTMTTKFGTGGISVIDFESWRPIFAHNFDDLKKYQDLSVDIVGKRYPYLSKSDSRKEASREFNSAARVYFEETLKLVHRLRPKKHWGFYGFPRHWNESVSNDKLSYIWKLSSGLFPRIYFDKHEHQKVAEDYISRQITETLRLFAKYSPPHTLILPYGLCQDNGSDFYSKENLTLVIEQPALMGTAGVVLWGSSDFFKTRNECTLLRSYINDVLGPFVRNLTHTLARCSLSLCHGHGRCVDRRVVNIVQYHRRLLNREQCSRGDYVALAHSKQSSDWSKSGDYPGLNNFSCLCFAGWSGINCQYWNLCGI